MDVEVIQKLGNFPMGRDGTCQVEIIQLKGRPTLSIRKWVKTNTYSGPTKQGIMLDRDALDWLTQNEIIEKAFIEIDELIK